jgi:hypothetical protein
VAKPVKSEFQKVLELIADSAEKRISHLPPKEAAAARKTICRIVSATAARGRAKSAKPARARARGASRRTGAKVS